MKEGIKLDEEIKVYFMQFRVEDRVHGQVTIVCIFLFLFFPLRKISLRYHTYSVQVLYASAMLYITVIRIQIPGSGSFRTRYGSGSFYHQAKIVRKTLIPTVCDFFITFYL
jgi:hypothetical protein